MIQIVVLGFMLLDKLKMFLKCRWQSNYKWPPLWCIHWHVERHHSRQLVVHHWNGWTAVSFLPSSLSAMRWTATSASLPSILLIGMSSWTSRHMAAAYAGWRQHDGTTGYGGWQRGRNVESRPQQSHPPWRLATRIQCCTRLMSRWLAWTATFSFDDPTPSVHEDLSMLAGRLTHWPMVDVPR